MSRMVSTATMIGQLEGLLGTRDLTPRESEFVESLTRLRASADVTALSERQVNWLGDLWKKHFA